MDVNNLKIVVLEKEKWWNTQKYSVIENFAVGEHSIPKEFISDSCTIPRWLTVFGLALIVASFAFDFYFLYCLVAGTIIATIPVMFPPIEKGGYCCFLHDYLLHEKNLNRKEIDVILRDCLKDEGVASWRYTVMFIGVRIFSISKQSAAKVKSIFVKQPK